MKSRPKLQQLPVKRIPVHELFPQPPLAGTRLHGPSKPTAHAGKGTSSPTPRKKLPTKNALWGLVFFGLILGGFGIFGTLRRSEAQLPYALLEIRALEEGGHPVTAATVVVNDKPMGVTDSFGEWRRYLQLKAGDTVHVALDKKGTLSGSKDVDVPKRTANKQDIEMQVAITMTNPKMPNKANSRTAAKPEVLPEPESEAAMSEPKPMAQEITHEREGNPIADTNDNSLGIYFDDGLNRISIGGSASQAKAANLMDKRQQDVVRERIVPVLANDLQNLGLTVDKNSPWKLALSYVPNGEQVGYIKADIEWHTPFGQTEKSSFIAGFAKTYEETGRGLSSLLRLHMKKTYWAFKDNGNWFIDETTQTKDFWKLKAGSVLTDTDGNKFPLTLAGDGGTGRRWKIKFSRNQPCESVRQRSRCMVSTESLREAPPLAGWTLKRVRILGPVPQNSDVYVAGFQAHPVGSQQWEFWSRSGSSLKALVVVGGRIVHSESFQDNPGEAVLLKMAAIPSKATKH